MEDNEFILESARNLKRWEETPGGVADDYADMNRDELIKLIFYLRERLEEADFARKESDRRISELTDKVSELTEQLRKGNDTATAMAVQMSELLKQLREKDGKIAELQSTVKVGRRHLFDRKSQKGTSNRDKENRQTPHTDVEDDFDGTPESQPKNLDLDVNTEAPGSDSPPCSSKGVQALPSWLYLPYDGRGQPRVPQERPGQAARRVCRDKDVSEVHIRPEGGQLPRPFLEPGFPLQERRELHDRQQPGGTVHPTAGEREEKLAFLRQPQDGARQRGLPLHCVHLQATGVLDSGIPQEILY